MKTFKQYIISEAMNPVKTKPSEFPNPYAKVQQPKK